MVADLDDIDRTILRLLQDNGRIANAEIGRIVGLSGQSVQERIRKLEAAGVVRGYEVVLDPGALGLEVTAFVEITIPSGRDYDSEYAGLSDFSKREPEVLEQHGVAGDIDLILEIRSIDIAHLNGLLNRLHGVTRAHTKTIIVLNVHKETQRVVIPGTTATGGAPTAGGMGKG